MLQKLKKVERAILVVLIIIMISVVVLSTIRLVWKIIEEMLNPPIFLLNVDQLFVVFGFVLMILIGLELLESIKAYIEEDQVHVEVIFTIALIAVARKVITLDLTKLSNLTLLGIASIIMSLAVGYFLIRKAHYPPKIKHRDKD